MKKLFLILLISISGWAAEPATKDDIKIILEQMDKKFEQVDKRFEQIERRLDVIEKRQDFMQNILYLLLGLVIASPFLAEYIRAKRDSEKHKLFDTIRGILFALREQAQTDEKLAKSLKAAGIM